MGDDTPLVWYEGSGTSDKRWLSTDERGSITAITNSSGAIVNINSYDAWGIPQSTNIGRFGYTGQAWVPELGMYYYKARIYSPTLGRFLQTDPIGYEDGPNWYAYVQNDPVNYIDPTGLNTGDIVVIGRKPVSSGGGGGGSSGGTASASAAQLLADNPDLQEILVVGRKERRVQLAVLALGRVFIGLEELAQILLQMGDEVGDKIRKSKPVDAPRGTRPVDRDPRLSGDDIHDIKDDIGAAPDDWVGISPEGHIITTNPDGTAEDHGHYDGYVR